MVKSYELMGGWVALDIMRSFPGNGVNFPLFHYHSIIPLPFHFHSHFCSQCAYLLIVLLYGT